ncbi:hypothetical protein Anas_08868, partial [Armadillidium nasatum]
QRNNITIIFVSIFMLGANMASQSPSRHSWETRDGQIMNGSVKNRTFLNGNKTFQRVEQFTAVSSDAQTVTAVGYFVYVRPPPSMPCTSDSQCTDAYNLPVECRDGYCECRQPLCWIYTYYKNGIIAEISYTCGTCGQLGSECNITVPCDPPGYCGADNFCHCDKGEHRDDLWYDI